LPDDPLLVETLPDETLPDETLPAERRWVAEASRVEVAVAGLELALGVGAALTGLELGVDVLVSPAVPDVAAPAC
jgi:hypothetical protein